MISLNLDIPVLHDEALERWYARDGETASRGPAAVAAPGTDTDDGDDLRALVVREHFANYSIWRLEDQARRRDVGDEVIAAIKRAIDPWNQRRNDLMESIDRAVLDELAAAGAEAGRGEQHSETAAMMIDRLSILALKIRNMAAAGAAAADPALAEECRGKLAILNEQRADLARCLTRLLEDFESGRRHFKMYRQLKSYNDPRLNPALRKTGAGPVFAKGARNDE